MNQEIIIPAIAEDGSLFPIEKMEAHRLGQQHLAISVFVFSGTRLLIQQRAAGKYHCPGRWANTCCSHPHWEETPEHAALRRVGEDRGLEVPVETWGSAGSTLVFLPGLGCPPGEYRQGIELAARRHRIVMLDLSFRTAHRLPRTVSDYYELVSGVTGAIAPGAPWCGHSFGALLALMRPGPAIAFAPSVPARIAFPRTVGRAARQQVREYLGFEGPAARRYAARILRDYALTAVRRPRSLFSITNDLRAEPSDYPFRSTNAVVYLSRNDDLYRQREYDEYFATAQRSPRVREVPEGHDWPITHPRLLGERIPRAMEILGRSRKSLPKERG